MKKKKAIKYSRLLCLLLVCLLAVPFAACKQAEQPAQEPTVPAQESAAPAKQTEQPAATDAPDAADAPEGYAFGSFSSVDLAGNEVTDSVFQNAELTMVNVWGTFCSPCIREMPDLGALAAEYADKGVQLIGIVIDVENADDPLLSTAKQIVADTGAEYLHLLPSTELWSAKLNTVSAIPTTFFIDASGNVISDDYIGSMSAAGWRKVIDEMLAQVS